MANALYLFLRYFKRPALDKMIMEDEVSSTNLVRCITITGLFVPITLIIHLYFRFGNFKVGPEETTWLNDLFFLNMLMGPVCLFLSLTGLFLKFTRREYSLMSKLLPHLVFFVFAICGALCAIFGQSLDNAIITFMLACVLNAATILIRPLYAAIYFILIYCFFCYGVTLTQPDQNTILFNAIDGLCVIAVSFVISWVLWNNNMTRFKQDRLIQSQKQILEYQYEKLTIANEELEDTNSSKDQFFSILAHDLRGPLNSALALTTFLEEGAFEEDTEERKKTYNLLQNSLSNSAKLLENVLLWSTNQAGILNFKPCTLDVLETLKSSIDVLKIVAAQKNIEIINNVPGKIMISADVDMIHTVFRNLLSNAIKFTPNFGSVEINAEILDTAVRISVIDYGVGMSSKTLSNLFRIEKKMPGRGTNNETGTGLGLVLCKDFIEKHEGSIVVESKENEGSKFIITLPGRT
ncbi:HAMP domain-containing sensor histidine kinase [Pedobacter sp. PLR]|uniref:sensor histidine kinase n=1 Tax=Pedobacter sp. PLR TaxID=2994465 RepID=UPI002247BF63|nr:HAMP domain-containing sensor histidine kinase [Pedobacter sp. PLR]MCX2453681.1 HAMP domain-containing sensor histidine kinase [Pedobacter sp. PLR]